MPEGSQVPGNSPGPAGTPEPGDSLAPRHTMGPGGSLGQKTPWEDTRQQAGSPEAGRTRQRGRARMQLGTLRQGGTRAQQDTPALGGTLKQGDNQEQCRIPLRQGCQTGTPPEGYPLLGAPRSRSWSLRCLQGGSLQASKQKKGGCNPRVRTPQGVHKAKERQRPRSWLRQRMPRRTPLALTRQGGYRKSTGSRKGAEKWQGPSRRGPPLCCMPLVLTRPGEYRRNTVG